MQLSFREVTVRWYSLALLAIVLAVYGNTLLNGYAMDDATVIHQNVIVKKGLAGIPDILTTPRLSGYMNLTADSYRPVSLILFAVEYQLWGANPMMGHLMTILLFAACVLVLFSFLRRLPGLEGTMVPFLAAAIFAVHPVHTEVVANIKSCDELLAFLLGFGALHVYANYVRDGRAGQLVAGLLLYLVACFSKETVVTFVAIVPLLFFVYLNSDKRRAWVLTAGTAAAVVLFVLVSRAVLASHGAAMQGAEDFTTNALIGAPLMAARIPTAIAVLGRYLLLLVYPAPLLCNYSFASVPFYSWGSVVVLLSVVVYGAMKVFAFARMKRQLNDLWAFAVWFYLLSIGLFSNIFFLVTSQMAERFLFLPSVGFCLAVALAIWYGARQSARVAAAVLFPLLVVFGGMTIARNAEWKDDATLFAADVQKAPDDCKLNYYKALSIGAPAGADEAQRRQVIDEKMTYLRKALEIYPEFTEAHTEIAKLFEAKGQYDSALMHNMLVLRNNRSNSIAAYHAANEYYALKQHEQAILWYKATIELVSDYRPAYLNIARCYADIGICDSSIVYYSSLLALGGASPDVYKGMALCYMQAGRYDSAATYMMQVTRSTAATPDDQSNLGAIYMSAGKNEEALICFRKALQMSPGNRAAFANMAAVFEKLGNKDSAAYYRSQLQ
jgi:tetratricopeptide (TPR) repeat protein